ncbi:MAG TPA: DUF4199 domain-containing protein [Bacteroidia bacterium]|nr:DUF4199 domain-containing protein [Bacteroidia bacterium]
MKKSDIIWNVALLGSLTGYFMLMKLLGLHQILGLRYLNLLFQLVIVYMAMKSYRSHTTHPFSFLDTAMAGVRASVPAVILFAGFQFVFLRWIDPGFMLIVKETAPMGDYLSPALAALAIAAEGVLMAFFSAYVGMRLLAAQEHAKFPAL